MNEIVKLFEKETGKKVALTISAGAFIRIDELKDMLISRIPERNFEEETETQQETTTVYDLKRKTDPKKCYIERLENGDFRVRGERLEEIARMTDTRYPDGVGRVYDVMERFGVMRKIKQVLMDELLSGRDSLKTPQKQENQGNKKFSK